jgi:2OG-Fe(II) oxygenase superfamily
VQRLIDLPQMLPHVTVDGNGRLGFPIQDVSSRQLISSSEKAPFGKLDQTLMDTKVRDAWQIHASKITIGGGDTWSTYFSNVVRQSCFHLGISSERFDALGISATLDKMLIYEKDGHFLTHRDTEKKPQMFGSLILQLPTGDGFQGGEFIVSHRGVTETIDLSKNSDNDFQAVAFYADCKHELRPITQGTRVCLAYNLVATLPKSNEVTTEPSNDINIETENMLRLIYDDWCVTDRNKLTRIGYQLEHEYTIQSLSFSNLKGRDRIIATTLSNAKNAQGTRLFRVSILLMVHHHTDWLDCNDYERETKPYIVEEEIANGLWKKRKIDCDEKESWDMNCYSKNGWWIMPNVERDSYREVKDDGDKKESGSDDDDDDKNYLDDNDVVPRDQQMFWFPTDVVTVEHSHNGNDGGERETFYYAAAIIISPWNDVVQEILKI